MYSEKRKKRKKKHASDILGVCLNTLKFCTHFSRSKKPEYQVTMASLMLPLLTEATPAFKKKKFKQLYCPTGISSMGKWFAFPTESQL